MALVALCFSGCKKDVDPVKISVEKPPKPRIEFGFDLNHYVVKRDTIRSGDSFGHILSQINMPYPKIYQIVENIKEVYDIRRLQVGKPYLLLCSTDSLKQPQHFIYQPNMEEFVVINFKDSINAYVGKKPVKYVEKWASGVIESNISETLEKKGLSPKLSYKMADEIFAWTIDFRTIQKGDRFKVLYVDKYIDDTIYMGVHKIKAAFFEHKKEPYYAFEFLIDSVKGTTDYYNEQAKNVKRAFLKAPLKFSRISSRFNLKRKIAFYGFKIRPHKGTDFAAPVGTPIMATANGVVTESARNGGNGNYVKIRHHAGYETQYLHMQRRNVVRGESVRQGEVIGWVGMTGNTGGPHVCYRFWKNGVQVDPFTQKLSESKSISPELKDKYLEFIKPLRKELDAIN